MHTPLNAELVRLRHADLLAEAERRRQLRTARPAPYPPAWARVVVARMLVAAAHRLDPPERTLQRRAAGYRRRALGLALALRGHRAVLLIAAGLVAALARHIGPGLAG